MGKKIYIYQLATTLHKPFKLRCRFHLGPNCQILRIKINKEKSHPRRTIQLNNHENIIINNNNNNIY
jgi:hypothetical protein